MNRAFPQKMREWSRWWSGLSWSRRYFPVIAVAAYLVVLSLLKALGTDHLLMMALVLVLSYGGKRLEPLLVFMLPFILTLVVYDSQRHYSDLIRGQIHIDDLYDLEKSVFGIPTARGVLTPNEWCELSAIHPALDLLFGFFYLFFYPLYMAVAAYFFFWLGRKGAAGYSAAEMARLAPRMGWAFFWLNVAGYSTYFWFPAAPPWYVSIYGLGPANMSAVPSAAGCLRFDQLLGVSLFSGMYGKSADVFGAIPSLHVAYPLLAVYFAFRFGALRVFSVLFYLIMCMAAVYFNHHYIIDVVWGSVYALVAGVGVECFYGWRARRPSGDAK